MRPFLIKRRKTDMTPEWPQTDENGKVWTQAEWVKKCQRDAKEKHRDEAVATMTYWSDWTHWILPITAVLFLLWGFTSAAGCPPWACY
jgi:hypothetical protein